MLHVQKKRRGFCLRGEKKKASAQSRGPTLGEKDEKPYTGSQDSPEEPCLAARYGLARAIPLPPAQGLQGEMSSDQGPRDRGSEGGSVVSKLDPTPRCFPSRTRAAKGSGQALTREPVHRPGAWRRGPVGGCPPQPWAPAPASQLLAPSTSAPLPPEQRRPGLKNASRGGLVKAGFNFTAEVPDSRGLGWFSAQAKVRITWGVFGTLLISMHRPDRLSQISRWQGLCILGAPHLLVSSFCDLSEGYPFMNVSVLPSVGF